VPLLSIACGRIVLATKFYERAMLPTSHLRETADADKNRRRMWLAFTLLLTALVVVMIKDRAEWFGGDDHSAAEEASSTHASSFTAPIRPVQTASAPAPIVKAKQEDRAQEAVKPAEQSPIVTTDRSVLKPLQVEVVTDRTHRVVQTTTGTVNVDLDSNPETAAAASQPAPAPGALQRASLTYKVQAPLPYPALDARMKVQGSVLLQALVGADGVIRELQVVSGPAILSSAAREAALQWRFKPYYENGKAVETQARITVNFVIAVADDRVSGQQDAKKKGPLHTSHQAAHPGE